MQITKEDIVKFISLVTEDKDIEIKDIKKEIVSYNCDGNKRKIHKVNLHSLSVIALSMLSKKYNIKVNINKDKCIFKIDTFKLESNIKDWNKCIIFITLLKLN